MKVVESCIAWNQVPIIDMIYMIVTSAHMAEL